MIIITISKAFYVSRKRTSVFIPLFYVLLNTRDILNKITV